MSSRSSLLLLMILMGATLMANTVDPSGVNVNSSMLVSSEWLAQHLHDEDLVILCVAQDGPFYSQHIPGARLIPLDRLVVQGVTLNAIPPVNQLKELFEHAGVGAHSRIVIYGEKLGMLAARAYVTLDYLGLADRAALLDGGIEKWRSEGRQESKAIPHVTPTKLEPRINPHVVVSEAQVSSHVARHDAALIDARPHAEFTGEKRSEDVPKSGHIAGASGVYWMDLLTSREMPTLRSPETLIHIYREAGAQPGRKVITYCRTGMQASFDYFVAKYLGLPSRIYVSSFYEWSRSTGTVENSYMPMHSQK